MTPQFSFLNRSMLFEFYEHRVFIFIFHQFSKISGAGNLCPKHSLNTTFSFIHTRTSSVHIALRSHLTSIFLVFFFITIFIVFDLFLFTTCSIRTSVFSLSFYSLLKPRLSHAPCTLFPCSIFSSCFIRPLKQYRFCHAHHLLHFFVFIVQYPLLMNIGGLTTVLYVLYFSLTGIP